MDVEGTHPETFPASVNTKIKPRPMENKETLGCLLYTSDAADE